MDYYLEIAKLEQAKLQLKEKRKNEIFSLIERADALGLENDIIAGAILLAVEVANNKDGTEYKKLIEKGKDGFRKRGKKPNTKTDKTDNT